MTGPPRGAPRRAARAQGWLRANLFGGPWNTALTVAVLALVGWAVPPLANWVVFDAVWAADDPAACRAASGACWAVIHEKYRLILFGRYPHDAHWRPLLATVLLIGLVTLSCDRRRWSLKLAAGWTGCIVVYAVLMRGGVFGLATVETRQWGGLPLTLLLAVLGIAAAFPLSILLALGRRSALPAIRLPCIAYIELIRGVPLISLLFMGAFLLPLFLPAGVRLDAVLRAQAAIIVFAAAYLAEVVRGGLQAIPVGQFDASRALGLGYWQMMAAVILPQAIRVSIPPIVNTFIGLFKDTSLVAIVGLTDLLLAMRQAIADPAWRAHFIEAYVLIAAIYFVFCFLMSRYSLYLERQFATGQR